MALNELRVGGATAYSDPPSKAQSCHTSHLGSQLVEIVRPPAIYHLWLTVSHLHYSSKWVPRFQRANARPLSWRSFLLSTRLRTTQGVFGEATDHSSILCSHRDECNRCHFVPAAPSEGRERLAVPRCEAHQSQGRGCAQRPSNASASHFRPPRTRDGEISTPTSFG